MSSQRRKRDESGIDDDPDQESHPRNPRVRFDSKVESVQCVNNTGIEPSEPKDQDGVPLEAETNIKVNRLSEPLLLASGTDRALHQILAINCSTLTVAAAYSETQGRKLSILEDTQDSITFDLISSCKSDESASRP
jgi:hypothetical protein